MKKIPALPFSRLRTTLSPDKIPYANSTEIPLRTQNGLAHSHPQPRALKALELALNIDDKGYNIYLAGSVNLGRKLLLKDFLTPRAKKQPTPPDVIYVANFEDHDSPILIELPAGQGKKLKAQLSKTFTRIRKEIPGRFEHDAFIQNRNILIDKFQEERKKLFKQMDRVAEEQGFNLDMDERGGLTLYPLIEGKRLSEEEFEKLDADLRDSLKIKGDQLLQDMSRLMRKLSRTEEAFSDGERKLEREVINLVLNLFLTPVAEQFKKSCSSPELDKYFEDLRRSIIENQDSFLPKDVIIPNDPPLSGTPVFAGDPPPQAYSPDITVPYEVNLFVDNSKTRGAPIIFEDHPIFTNLMGCIEREAEMGALVTDFTLIKAGAIHRANRGFLIMRAEDILQHPAAWESMLRALSSQFARIEEGSEGGDSTKTKGLTPESMPLDLKVVLIGTEEIYESLLLADDRFAKLFKIKAHLTETTSRNAAGFRLYLARMARIISESKLLPFTREALAEIITFGSHICEDQKKLSLKFALVRELMIEASALASMNGKNEVDDKIIMEAHDARIFRANLFEEHFLEEYDRELIKVPTSGKAVGLVNGLAVTWFGDFEFGLPHQISCTVGVGHGGIIDLEREAELSGPIHTKAIMILKSYLVSMFARNKPLVLTGSLCFEQNYAGVEGDSASAAELAALLSALADVPINLSLACTGAVSQTGNIMAVGSVTRKIEGFYEVCKRRGLSEGQGVIIPKDNIDHLMLKSEVVKSVEAGEFHIYPVWHISEVLALLTGISTGTRRKDGSFTPGSRFHKVDRRLDQLGRLARKHESSGC